jgi:nondiscriminating glutamyl-tRNA synthetase
MVKVRFAPSPTGHLHIGNARTAVINHLFAQSNHGWFILRVEDTDVERSEASYETSIIQDLKWLGLTWDQGPVRQSERLEIYREHAGMLLSKGAAYKCFCSRDRLDEMRQKSLARGEPPKYDGTCRALSTHQVEDLEKENRPYVVRFRSVEKPVGFVDEIHGKTDFPRGHVDDFVILKQGRMPTYNLAAAVDDMLMGITHVLRGADHLSNTPKQIMLFESFGATPPRYGHHSLLVGGDRKPLSKRLGTTRVSDFRGLGIVEEALVNYIGVLGRNLGREYMDREELVRTFSLGSLSPSDAVFDWAKLLWFNKEHLRRMPTDRLLAHLALDPGYRDKVEVLKGNAETLHEVRGMLRIFDDSDMTDEGFAYLSGMASSDAVAGLFKAVLADGGDVALDHTLERIKNKAGLPNKELFMALRVMATGRVTGPPLKDVFHLIPKDHMIQRVEWLLNQIRSGQ